MSICELLRIVQLSSVALLMASLTTLLLIAAARRLRSKRVELAYGRIFLFANVLSVAVFVGLYAFSHRDAASRGEIACLATEGQGG